MSITIDSWRMILRHFFSGLLVSTLIYIIQTSINTNFDNVAAVGLFSAVVVIIGEDVTLGPVIFKSIFRLFGVFLGGTIAYLLLLFTQNVLLSKSLKDISFFIFPCVYITIIQYLTKGGNEYITLLIKKNKGTHFLLQLQVGFGTVYFGYFNHIRNNDSNSLNSLYIALIRTFAIFTGCALLLIVSMLVLPQTSLYASAIELDICFKTSSELLITSCENRRNGTKLSPYNHKALVFGWNVNDIPIDSHTKCLKILDDKTSRSKFNIFYIFIFYKWYFHIYY